jgi:23S rRNA pseudouridine1911/1915/1917 synthase
MTGEPRVVAETEGFLVVYKPPLLHSAPLRDGDSLLAWCAERYPEVLIPRGPLPREGGLLHRLDYGTRGLVLLARTQEALDALRRRQQEGGFVKEYGALADRDPRALLPGFPPRDSLPGPYATPPFAVESAFRSYGPGGKAVRPVLPEGGSAKPFAFDQGRPYRTEILERRDTGSALYFHIRIARGFRHQIRCHLSWLGHPVLGDQLYGQAGGGGVGALMLKAQGLCFPDPLSGEKRRYRLPPILEDPGARDEGGG